MEVAPEKVDLMKQRKRLPITIEISTTDADGNRQTVVRRAVMRIGKA
jgi:hypothetical protein